MHYEQQFLMKWHTSNLDSLPYLDLLQSHLTNQHNWNCIHISCIRAFDQRARCLCISNSQDYLPFLWDSDVQDKPQNYEEKSPRLRQQYILAQDFPELPANNLDADYLCIWLLILIAKFRVNSSLQGISETM